ncbi:MAG: spondin domain-containing protein [Planctomycetota bacterium]
MSTNRILTAGIAAAALISTASIASAQQYRVRVLMNNVAPENGTFQTPFWVGFHDGTFDTYDGGTLASSLPIPGSVALERISEDGNTGPLMADFATLAVGRVDATVPGPNGPLAPGDVASQSFLLDPNDPRDRYFSYASMILPSNDGFLANGNPLAHMVFDNAGNFVAQDFFISGQNAANDAGTEANDELPFSTAFFGQMAPNTGVTTSDVIATHPGFNARGTGGILDSTRHRLGDFTIDNYAFMRVGFRAAPAVTEDRTYGALAIGGLQVPPVASSGIALTGYALLDQGKSMLVIVQAFGLADLQMAHLHLAPAGANGPVVVDLLENAVTTVMPGFFLAEIKTGELAGPLSDFPLDALVNSAEAGNVYVNLHTTANPSGELRGQLSRLQ